MSISYPHLPDQHSRAMDSATKQFSNHCEELLSRIHPRKGTLWEDVTWNFAFSNKRYTNRSISLDFSAFAMDELLFVKAVTVVWDEVEIKITPMTLAKWIFLEFAHNRSVDYRLVWTLDVFKMLFFYLKEQQCIALTPANMQDFFSLLLTSDFDGKHLVQRHAVPAFGSRFKQIDFAFIYKLLKTYKIDVLITSIPKTDQNHFLNEACLAQTGMTLSDYKAGGTFDFLGLDVGRHFVDYCADIFESNITFATAINKTLDYMKTFIAKEFPQSRSGIKSLNNTVKKALKGQPLQRCLSSKRADHVPMFNEKKAVYKESIDVFCKYYNEAVLLNTAFSLDVLNAIAKDLGIAEGRFDTHEFIRSMLYTRFNDHRIKSRQSILKEYQASLKIVEFNPQQAPWQVHDFDLNCDKYLMGLKITPDSASEFCSTFLRGYRSKTDQKDMLGSLIADVEAAGVTVFLAYSGWRASELGFPSSSIQAEVNQDILDASYTPLRFYINWTASKTSGDTLLEREVTQSTAVLAQQLAELNCAGQNKPALVAGSFKDTIDGGGIVANRVSRLWLTFPHHYTLFKELDELEKFSGLSRNLTASELSKRSNLLTKYEIDNSIVRNFIELKQKLRMNSAILALSRRQYQNERKSTVRFSETLKRYREGKLDVESMRLLDERLSENTKTEVLSLDYLATTEMVNAVREEFVEGTIKPTPHAFRHMWAEAVLQRYRGDIGRFIRANFKHIDERFFMAYLRNKEVKSIYDVAKRTTINAVVRKHVASIKDNKRSYAGGFDRFVSKAVSITRVGSHKEYEEIANKIAKERIVDIKTNPWATCLLRVNTANHAKCSVDGVPQRQNAEPKLCLGCINADISGSNFAGIVIYTKSDVEACENPNLPFSIKRYHVDTLKKALARVKELKTNEKTDSYDAFITHLTHVVQSGVKEGGLDV